MQTKQRAKLWSILHLSSTVVLIGWNYVSNAGLVFDSTVGSISARYETSFTPAGYAFSIWAVIYLGLLALGGLEVYRAFFDSRSESPRFAWIERLGWPFLIAQLSCGSWLAAWLSGAIWLSLCFMTALLLALLWAVVSIDMERWDAPWSVIALCWWPLSLYSGWISVAWLANVGSALAASGVGWVTTPAWALSVAGLLIVFHIIMIFWRNMREFSAVGVWALVAVAVRHESAGLSQVVMWGALSGALLLVLASAGHAIKNFNWPPALD